MGVAAQ